MRRATAARSPRDAASTSSLGSARRRGATLFARRRLLDGDDLAHPGHAVHHDPLDARLEREDRRRAGAAGAHELQVDDAVILVDADEDDVATVGLHGRTDQLDDLLDLLFHGNHPPTSSNTPRTWGISVGSPASVVEPADVGAEGAELAGQVLVAAVDMLRVGHHGLAVGGKPGDHEGGAGPDVGRAHGRAREPVDPADDGVIALGADVGAHPGELVDVPAPVTRAPMRSRKAARSAISGSRAALSMTVTPLARTAAMRMFSVAPTLGNSSRMRVPVSCSARPSI